MSKNKQRTSIHKAEKAYEQDDSVLAAAVLLPQTRYATAVFGLACVIYRVAREKERDRVKAYTTFVGLMSKAPLYTENKAYCDRVIIDGKTFIELIISLAVDAVDQFKNGVEPS